MYTEFRVNIRHCGGFSLPEVILFIVILSIAMAGVLLAMNNVTARGADSLSRKQALAVAESMMEEIMLQPASGVVANPSPATNSNRSGFDNVFNYNGYGTSAGILDFSSNTAVAGLGGYNIAPPVSVAYSTAPWLGIPAGSTIIVQVHVTGPAGQVDLTGYRTVY